MRIGHRSAHQIVDRVEEWCEDACETGADDCDEVVTKAKAKAALLK